MMFSRKPLFPKIFFLFSLLTYCGLFGQKAEIAYKGVFQPMHKSQLNTIQEKAQKAAAENLNRYAIEHLKNYDGLIDTFSNIELADSIAILEKEYKLSTGSRIEELTKNKFSIQELTNAKSSNLRRYNALLRKAGIAFGLWFLIVLILLQIRKRHLRKQTVILKNNNIKLESLLAKAELGNKYTKVNKAILEHNIKIETDSSQLFRTIHKGSSGDISKISINKDQESINSLSQQLWQLSSTELRNSQFIESVTSKPETEPSLQDINLICETAIEIAGRGASTGIPEDVLKINTDLEKNLPQISILKDAVSSALLNLLNNAFQSVKIKYDEGVKGYQPTVTLSTRILPRFLQIRIRDNGDGIPKDQVDKILTEFYTLRPLDVAAGLGLSDSQKLLGEPNKAEMRIESDLFEGTNVYIKFFL